MIKINQIVEGDCVEVLKWIEDETFDLCVTSPPYNIGIKYKGYSDNLTRSDYLSWIAEVAREIKRVLKAQGSFFLNVGNIPSDQSIASDVDQELRRIFTLQNTIHWIKSIAVNDSSYGHFKPINSERYLTDCHEFIFHYTKTGSVKVDKLAVGTTYKDKSNIGRWKAATSDLRDRGNVWFIPYDTITSFDQRPHPASFPVRLPEMCIKLHGVENALVLDPFSGLGTTAIGAIQNNCRYFGIEKNSEYLKMSLERIKALTVQAKLAF